MKPLDVDGMLAQIATAAEANNPISPDDPIGADGLHTCHVCGAPKEVLVPALGRVMRCSCRCDLERWERQQRELARQERMRRVEGLRRYSLMDGRLEGATFAAALPGENAQSLRRCRQYALRFAQMRERRAGLLLYGPPGTGKTYAAACIANALLEAGTPVLMTSMVKVLGGGYDMDELLGRMRSASLLILDDFGAERDSGYAIERAYALIDAWYNLQKPMVLTTNWTMSEISRPTDGRYAKLCDRIASLCKLPLPFAGPSWRVRDAAEGGKELLTLLDE